MEAFRHAYADVNDLGTDVELDLETFEAGLHGSIVLPGSPDYDLARQVHDARSRRAPGPDRPRGRRRRTSRGPSPRPRIRPARCRSAAAATASPATAPTTAGSSSTSAP